MRILHKLLIVCITVLALTSSYAETFPGRAIRLVVPFPPGQSADILGRIVGEHMALTLKQPVIIENRPGAGGVIGTAYVAGQPPDGYTLVVGGSGPMTISPTLQPGVAKYDAVESFSSIAGIAKIAQVIVVPGSSPIRNLQELVGRAKQKAGAVTYASSGNGTTQHLFMEMLSSAAGIKMTHVPYKGSAPALSDLIGGQIDVMSDTITAMTPLIRSGKVRAIAVTSAKRWPTLAEVPTVAEQGYSSYAAEGWIAFLAPAGTPPGIVAQLDDAVKAAMADPATRSKITELGFLPMDSDHLQLRDFLKSETAKFKTVIETSNIKVD